MFLNITFAFSSTVIAIPSRLFNGSTIACVNVPAIKPLAYFALPNSFLLLYSALAIAIRNSSLLYFFNIFPFLSQAFIYAIYY